MNQGSRTSLLVVTWLWVGAPFAYGVYALITRVIPLFIA